MVHEILSQAFDTTVKFDDVADRLMTMVRDVATTRSKVEMQREGSFGCIPADVATNLSLVFTEVCQNAIEHGLAGERGRVLVRPVQQDGILQVDAEQGATLRRTSHSRIPEPGAVDRDHAGVRPGGNL